LRSAFEEAGIEFIPENGGGAGVRLAKRTGASPSSPAAELETVLKAFTERHLPSAMKQKGVGRLHFVRAGPQATLMEDDRAIGMMTVRGNRVVFSPALPTGQTDPAGSPSEDDLWNWLIQARRQA